MLSCRRFRSSKLCQKLAQVTLTAGITLFLASKLIAPGALRSENNKVILFWYHHTTFYDFGEGSDGFREHKCLQSACALTGDRRRLAEADAVILHAPQIKTRFVPRRASEDQIFVFLVYESPLTVPEYRLANLTGVFNLTMTYMNNSDTDIHVPYGRVLRRKSPHDSHVPSLKEIGTKTRNVSWLVSNCRSVSYRREYAEILGTHIGVDVYGECGDNACPKANASCFNHLVKDHLFMLAFENSYCEDYVSEKVFRALKTNIVPIVYGGANYTRFLPPNSFIDVRDFKTPSHLAGYLRDLYADRAAYRQYLTWKRDYYVVEREYTRPVAMCQLCAMLHDEKTKYRKHMNPIKYWSRRRHCLWDKAERSAVHI